METIKHFTHEHTLELQEHQTKTSQSCYGCHEDIVGAMYSCSTCKFFLHKECANLPLEFYHPSHSEHPLILHAKPMYTCKCVFCNKPCEGFTYHCSRPEFGLCLKCAFLAMKNRKVRLDCHPQHPLTLMQKPAKFHCDACDKDEEDDVSYACDICPFWIHHRCSNLPGTRPCSDSSVHPHELSLAYQVPGNVLQYQLKCEICRENFKLFNWLYYCGPCKYFVHLKCESGRSRRLEEIMKWCWGYDIGRHWGGLIFSLPRGIASDLIKPFLNGKSSFIQRAESEMQHFSHDHRLVLKSSPIENKNGEEILCDACIQPILGQYYTCVLDQCGYLLHSDCAYLPREVQLHPAHLTHGLTLKNLKKELGYFYCSCCHMTSNGFFFECEICSFKLDLHCAILSSVLAHQGHDSDHALCCKEISDKLCEACDTNIDGFGYKCYVCRDFYLHYQCAILPLEVRHRWDDHNLLLQFQPVNHRDEYEFYCEVCEKEIHPKRWHYYCQECDQSFHPSCIPRLGKDRFMKFGSTIKVDGKHEHLLTSVRESRFDSSCHSCGEKLYRDKRFECKTCTFFLCYGCACPVPPKPSHKPSLTDLPVLHWAMLYKMYGLLKELPTISSYNKMRE